MQIALVVVFAVVLVVVVVIVTTVVAVLDRIETRLRFASHRLLSFSDIRTEIERTNSMFGGTQHERKMLSK